ncbi:MAG: transcription termination/antitermination protein NusG [Oscillospiraceae bacterium]|nr:transcription termination/antitermination protein NusG [Oscillospiraceae bacterium]
MSDSSGAQWYVAHTYSGYENKVASTLQQLVDNRGLGDMIQEIRVPTEMVTEIKDDKKREVERKIFPGYVLVKMVMTNETWYIVRNTRGCTGFVGPESKPVPLTDDEIARLGVDKEAVIELPYDVGDAVKIVDGPLEGFVGVVDKIDKAKSKVCVIVSMFGRETPAELEFTQIVSIE